MMVWPIILAFSWLQSASAFSFTAGSPTSCDDLTLSWSGGTAPYSVLLTPVFGTPRNYSVPSSLQNSYTISSLPFPKGQKMVITMSDATGLATGGNTALLQVGASTSGGSCNTTDPGVDFSFQLNSALQQCRTYSFSGYSKAVQPVTIMGLIPDGDPFTLFPPKGQDSYDWTANVYNGTDIIFLMFDSKGQQGGSSDLETVGSSDDSSCINSKSPSVTADSSTSVTTPTSTSSSAASQTSSASSGGTSIGAIAGTVAGALVFLAAVISLVLFLMKKRQEERKDLEYTSGADMRRQSRRLHSEVDLTGEHEHSPYRDFAPTPGYPPPAPFYQPPPSETASSYRMSMSNVSTTANPFVTPVNPFVSPPSPTTSHATTTMTAAQRKAAMAGVSTQQPRYILHTDLEDEGPVPNEDGVVELPPQYTERQQPPPSTSQRPL